MKLPLHGFTRSGHAVHGKTVDHMKTETVMQRFNKRLAIAITTSVGTMWCAYFFCLIAGASLPATLVAAHVVHFHSILSSQGFILCVSWMAQTLIQLVLLSVIIVGQNIQAVASDARAAKTFDDTELILDRVDEATTGGIKTLLDHILVIESKL